MRILILHNLWLEAVNILYKRKINSSYHSLLAHKSCGRDRVEENRPTHSLRAHDSEGVSPVLPSVEERRFLVLQDPA